MKLLNFETLTFTQKAKIVLSEGTYILKSDFKNLEISLYKIGNEFIEIWYVPSKEKVIKIEYLENKKISPYLKHLNILSQN